MMQFSKLLISENGLALLSEDECWEFFADNMAPFTSPHAASTLKESVENTLPVSDAKQVIDSFFHSLRLALQLIE